MGEIIEIFRGATASKSIADYVRLVPWWDPIEKVRLEDSAAFTESNSKRIMDYSFLHLGDTKELVPALVLEEEVSKPESFLLEYQISLRLKPNQDYKICRN